MVATGADPTGEGTGVHVTDTAGLTLTLRTPDAGGTAGAGYAPEESSFTDALRQVVEKSPLAAHAFPTPSADLYAVRLLEKPSEVQFTGNP